MQTKAYVIAIVLLSTIAASLFVGNSMVYSSSDDDDDDDDENHPCYQAGFEAGRSSSFNQTQQNDCGNTGYSHAYYEGFYRVAYHPAEEITLHAIQRQMDS
jgi:hypothetical protein